MDAPLRSWMFVPGNSQRFLDKVTERGIGIDAVFLDLEDGVPFPEKQTARELIRKALGRPSTGAMRLVRLSSVETEQYETDLQAVCIPGIDGVCLPKVESSSQISTLSNHLSVLEGTERIQVGSTRIVAAVESAAGLLAAPSIAAADPRLIAIMFGAEDFALDLGLGTVRTGEAQELLYARSALVLACAAAKVMSIDGVYPNLDDYDGFVRDAEQARRLGFTGKSTFNPRQVDVINRVFSPSQDEVEYAVRVVGAFEEAQARGDGSVAVGGQLVDLPIVLRAQRTLKLVQLLGDPVTVPPSRGA